MDALCGRIGRQMQDALIDLLMFITSVLPYSTVQYSTVQWRYTTSTSTGQCGRDSWAAVEGQLSVLDACDEISSYLLDIPDVIRSLWRWRSISSWISSSSSSIVNTNIIIMSYSSRYGRKELCSVSVSRRVCVWILTLNSSPSPSIFAAHLVVFLQCRRARSCSSSTHDALSASGSSQPSTGS